MFISSEQKLTFSRFFMEPSNATHRQYEALRAYFVEGVSSKEAARRAYATVNKETGGGKKSGSGRGKKRSYAASRKGGRVGGPRGGKAAARRPAAARSRSAKKAAATRKRRSAR